MIDWETIEHFRREEFCCRCGSCGLGSADRMNPEVIEYLEVLRAQFGKPIKITSGYRCERHPVEAAKKKPGSHSRGVSIDVAVYGTDAFKLLEIVMADNFFDRIGVNQKGSGRFFHLQRSDSVQPTRTIFSY